MSSSVGGTPAARGSSYARSGALADDLVAAAIVIVLLVPQSLAYALLAELPPVVGVIAGIAPVLAYAAFGSSRTLAVGPVALLALMTAAAAGPAARAHGVTPHVAALVLACEMALILAAAAVLRLHALAALLSAPVLHGFVTGAAIVIALGQLPALLGVRVQGQTLWELVRSAAAAPTLAPHAATAAVGLGALALLWATRRWGVRAAAALGLSPRAAQLAARLAPMAIVIGAIAAVAAGGAWSQGVPLAGRVDLAEGLRFEPPWTAPAALWLALLPAALMLALVAYVEGLAVAESLAARRGEKIDPRRELWGLAAANGVAGVGGGMPVTGSFSRSSVVFDAGARTRMAGAWAAIGLALAVAAMGDWLRHLPRAVLAATILVAVLALVDFRPFAHAWRWSRAEGVLMAAVAAVTVVLGVEPALALGVAASVALLLQRTARPHWAEVGRLPGTEVFRNVNRFDVQTRAGVLAVRLDESLLFTNARWVAETLLAEARARAGLREMVLMMPGVNDIDFTGAEALHTLADELRGLGVRLHLSEVKGPVRDRLEAAGFAERLTGQVFRTQHEADLALGGTGPDAGAEPPSSAGR